MFGKFFKNINFLKYINIPIFLISLVVGLGMVYLTSPDDRIIYVYPTHENADSIQYRDKTGSCFDVKETEVVCPKKEEDIAKLPIQS